MKRKISVIILSVLAVGIISYFPVKYIIGKNDVMSQWGNILSKQTQNEKNGVSSFGDTNYKLTTKGINSQSIVSGEEIYEAGTDVLISKQEVEQAKEFYVLQGQSEKNAEKEAVKYMEEFNAMYVEAVNNGFDVTEQEVDDYISELQKVSEEAENADDVKKVIAQFESEDAYWEYQKTVCRKQLPIQKYVAVLEKNYLDKIENDVADSDTTDLWNKELDKIKEKAAEKQKYKRVQSDKDIDKKFEVNN